MGAAASGLLGEVVWWGLCELLVLTLHTDVDVCIVKAKTDKSNTLLFF